MAWNNCQKALCDLLYRAIALHLAEWDASFDDVLEVLDAVRHTINVQRKTHDRPQPPGR